MKIKEIFVLCFVCLALLLLAACQSSEPVIINTIEPGQGFVGTVITIHGSGFTMLENDVEFVHENLTFNQDNTAYHQNVSSPDGKSITFTLPEYLAAGAPSQHEAMPDIAISMPRGEVQISILNKNGRSNPVNFTIKEADVNENIYDIDNEDEFWAGVEFDKPTEKWFNPGPLGYGISTGPVPPGSEVSIYVTPDKKMNVDVLEIRAKLTHRDENWALLEELKKNTVLVENVKTYDVLTVKLPENQGEYYLLTAEIIGEKGEVLDTLLSKIYVPLQGLSADLVVERKVYDSKDTVKFQVINHGPTVLHFGRPFAVEAEKNGKWVELPLELMFTMELIMLKPGEFLEQTLGLKDFQEHFKEGRYRIVKQVSGEGTDIQDELSVEFEVR
ncbi:IPT/TIG domain-containing protein [Candidatus Contubernalis alkaliaceticus]|uniref:IPT/TIG domain-containing protein n=1 Tax=Candidatus Contubernalis alkaliaceticus TaxID=338645 RepID=UPI001F4C041F|nr:IPT/TIG domain-containing protein [Candidatus Contubernalis alkalaceticus]UNC91342.1 IPT/TIG domain-containing protein [Candidatus Contubernalis alkalaceticus]